MKRTIQRTIQNTTGLLVGLALLAMPASTFAAPATQEGLDEATLAAIQQAAIAMYGGFAGGAPIALTPTGAPTPESTPEATEVPNDGPVEVEVGEFVEYTSPELTMSFPENWEISEDNGSIFNAEEEATGLTFQIENFGEDVPGLLMLPVFEGQSELFAQQLGEGASIDEISRTTIGPDELPALRMTFAGVEDPFAGVMDGVIYIIAAGRDGYGLYAGAESEAWQTLGPVVDEIVAGMQVNPEYINLVRAGDEATQVFDDEGTFALSLPVGWYGAATGDEELGIVFSDPGIAIVGAAGLSPESEVDDPMLQMLIEAIAGTLDEESLLGIVQAVIDNMELGGNDEVSIDEAQTTVLPSNSDDILGIIRVVGDAPIMDDANMPFTLYVSVYPDRAGAFVVFGQPDDILPLESDIVAIIDSLEISE